MKEFGLNLTMLLILAIVMGGIVISHKETNRHLEERLRIAAMEPIHDTVWIPTDYPRLIRALIDVESKGDPNAVNSKSGASGLLQLMPIYVKEANRILGKEVYKLEDRFDPVKTLEMFCIIQDHHNPKQDIDTAIKLHNRGNSYYKLVKNTIY